MYLSPHFTLAEAMRSQYAARHGLDNTPPPDMLPALRYVAAAILEPIRAHYGVPFTPSSWYRSAAVNAGIGGSKTSQHRLGEAVDVEIPGVSNIELAYWCRDNLKFDQLILECWDGVAPTSGWVHISSSVYWRDVPKVLTFTRGSYLAGLP